MLVGNPHAARRSRGLPPFKHARDMAAVKLDAASMNAAAAVACALCQWCISPERLLLLATTPVSAQPLPR